MRGLKVAAVVAAAVAVSGAGAFAAAVAFFPFETSVALRKLALRRGGVRAVRAATLAGLERDDCVAGAPCRCVALVHGMGDSSLTWDKVMLGLGVPPPPAGTRVLALDLPGTGDSVAPATPAGYGVPEQARALKDALASRCPKWTVAGNSLGGWISAELALQWPEGVEELVLVNAAGLYDDSGLLLQTAKILSDPTVATLKDFVGRAYAKPRAVPSRAWQAVVDSMKARPIKEVYAAFRLEDVLDRRARAIRAPTVILWGEADRVVPASMATRMAKLIPGARLELIPDCGHLPQQECPLPVSRALGF
ncbi:MAG: alpha/beta hydrolase [Elusimicrobiota bacterium]|nr:alpha/beta hydrolase [Elusimicrobiota bacterium]